MPAGIRVADSATGKEYVINPMHVIGICWPDIVECISSELAEEDWCDFFRDYAREHNLTVEQLVKTLVDVYNFCRLAPKANLETVKECIDASGFLNNPLPAQMVILSKLGQRVLGAFWSSIRDVASFDKALPEFPGLVEASEKLSKYIDERHNHAANTV